MVGLLVSAPGSSLWRVAASKVTNHRHEAAAEASPMENVRAATHPSSTRVKPTVSGDVAIKPPPATFDAPAAAPAPPPAALRISPKASPPPSGGVWAVIIGIDDYPGSGSDLRASVNDANDVDAALAAYGVPGDRRLVLRNTQASAATIADAVRWLVARAGTDATAVFFYAGHVRKLGAGSEAIVAADGRVITDRAVAELLRPLAAKQTWIGLAACYAGGFTEVLAPGRILTGAADANHLAYENAAYGRSYLVEFMVRRAMIQAQAPASVEQSYAWAVNALNQEHPDRMPVQYDSADGEIRLGVPPRASTAAAAPPPPSSGGAPAPAPAPDEEPADPPKDEDGCIVRLGAIVDCDR